MRNARSASGGTFLDMRLGCECAVRVLVNAIRKYTFDEF